MPPTDPIAGEDRAALLQRLQPFAEAEADARRVLGVGALRRHDQRHLLEGGHGPGALDDNGKRVPPEVKPGDFVLFGKWSGTEVKIDGEDLLIMKESDIMGIVEGRKASKKAA